MNRVHSRQAFCASATFFVGFAVTIAISMTVSIEAVAKPSVPPPACAKKFKNALVITGGGLSPGVALGLIAGARAAGQKPDVVITTCGASMGGAIANSFPDTKEAKAYLTSREFHQYLRTLARVGKTTTGDLGLKLGTAILRPGHIPDAFSGNVIDVPETMPRMLPRQDYTSSPGETRLVTVAARALFKPEHAGLDGGGQTLYEQTYFTDANTAQALKGLPASMKKNFPDSPIHPWTNVKTGVSTVQAARASISDPFLVNPAKIGNDYYFAGAMDLFPIETAQALACNVTSTEPSSGYSMLEDMAVKRGFGFSQVERAAQLKKYKNVNWIPMDGANDVTMDPDIDGLELRNRIPAKYADFKVLIEKQFDFGYRQAMARYAPSKGDGLSPAPSNVPSTLVK